jgi:molybdopterin-guanine dinucleotide biosynthesis protein A
MGSTAISAIILAGGRGERLGERDKATLVLGGRTLVQRAAYTLASISDDVIVVRRADQSLTLDNARVVADLPSCQGVLAGIAAGLEAARHDWALIVACDMPFLNLTVIHHMIALARHLTWPPTCRSSKWVKSRSMLSIISAVCRPYIGR